MEIIYLMITIPCVSFIDNFRKYSFINMNHPITLIISNYNFIRILWKRNMVYIRYTVRVARNYCIFGLTGEKLNLSVSDGAFWFRQNKHRAFSICTRYSTHKPFTLSILLVSLHNFCLLLKRV